MRTEWDDKRPGRIPIGDARRIAEERQQPIVVVFGLDSDGRFNVTSYGQTKKLCKLGAAFADQFADAVLQGRVAPPPTEPPDRPKIVCLCGSTRFGEAWRKARLDETLADTKARLDELHLRKIDLADEVLMLNVGGYLGESSRRELAYAQECGKPVRWPEPDKATTGGQP